MSVDLPDVRPEEDVVDAVNIIHEAGPAGGWHRDCYLLRNRIVHKGHKPTSGEAFDSKVATGEFARWIGAVLEGDPRVADVKSFLQARPPSRPA